MSKFSPRENKKPKSVILSQVDHGDNYWDMLGDCKVREIWDWETMIQVILKY